jgi:primosomal protein N' (replication factor Y)
MKDIFQVCIPHTHRDFFDYYAEGLNPAIGARVWVPFRQQTRMGVVIGQYQPETPYSSTKFISQLIDESTFLSGEVLALCQWVSEYYQSPLSEVIPLALPKKYRLGEEGQLPQGLYYSLTLDSEKAHQLLPKRVRRQHELIDFLAHYKKPLAKKTIFQQGFNKGQLDALLEKQIIALDLQAEKPPLPSTVLTPPLPLNSEQNMAVHVITAHLDAYRCFLLQGVTGSGKTEVYLQVIAEVLAKGKQVLVLVPEIGLTPQLLRRFQERFHAPMAVIHSNLNDTERKLAWHWAKEEEVKLVIGTRAAIFTPMPSLGLIVVDEEHDASLKQMEGVRYSARDTALMRAHLRHIPIILGSATPSLESLYNATINKYTLLRLNQKAWSGSKPLHYQVLDIRNQTLKHGLAATSLQAIAHHLAQHNQVLVFINRRGYAPVLLCHQCGFMADCKACDAHLTLHRGLGQLICHHCGRVEKIPLHCKACQSHDLLPIGAGTQRVHEFLQSEFPNVPLLRMDRDEVRGKKALDDSLDLINRGDAQLIVGTQMLAKGHHFPRVTLVVVLDADNGFYNQDFRALERLGQLLTQVGGRAGRAEFPGEVIIQTHLPHHPMLNLLLQQGYDAFAHSLLTTRQQADLPPYHFLSIIRAQGKQLTKLLQFLHAIKEQLNKAHLVVLGPAPAPLARKAGYHRLQLLVKSPSRAKLKLALTEIRDWLTINKLSNGIRWNIDVDPIDLS